MTLAQLPAANGAAATSQTANGEREHGTQPETRIGGAEVLELTQFALKKAWIDEKIQFLASLPPVDAVTPQPPTRSPTTSAELEAWWQEHDRIEQEVDVYDMGDLARLKTFAKDASKQHLSPRDTDLIEITLTTLFAVDKLLHLLRSRRKALSLLEYRLKWEEQVAAAWEGHRAILADIPSFLAKSRWTPPPLPPPLTKLDSPTSSTIPASSSSSSLSASRGHASAMSRTMRSEILSLELARSKSRLHAFTSSTIPSTTKSLDKLIDTSPAPLPDSFLDEQDRLEDSAKELLQGLDGFLVDMVKQWRASDELYWKARKLQEAAETVEREVEEAVLKLPQRSLAEAFETRERAMRCDLEEGQLQLARGGVVPTPTHGAAPEQVVENARLLGALRESFASAATALDSSRRNIQRYRFASETLECAQTIRAEMERSAVALEHFVTEAAQLAGPPSLDDERCLPPTPSELAFEAQYDSLSTNISPLLASAPQLFRDASSTIVDLNRAGIDPNIRHATKQTMQRMRDAQVAAQQSLKDDGERRARLGAARALVRALEEAEDRVSEARAVTLGAIEASRWSPSSPPSPPPLDTLLEVLHRSLDSSLSSSLANASKLLPGSHPTLHDHLQTRASNLSSRFADVHRLSTVASHLRAQSLATRAVLSDVNDVEDALRELSNGVTSDLVRSRADWAEGELDARRLEVEKGMKAVDARLTSLIDVVHTRILFLATSSTFLISSPVEPSSLPPCLTSLPPPSPPPEPTPLPFDLSQSDQAARTAVNEATAAASGRLEELRRLLALLEHQQQAFAWDSKCCEAEDELEIHEAESAELRKRFDGKDSDDEDVLESLTDATKNLLSRCDPFPATFAALSESLAILRAAPSATDALFQSHLQVRQPSLVKFQARHSYLLSSLTVLQADIAQTSTAGREREVAEQRRLEAEPTHLATWHEQKDGRAAMVQQQEEDVGESRLRDGEKGENEQQLEPESVDALASPSQTFPPPSFNLEQSPPTPETDIDKLDLSGLPLHPQSYTNDLRRSRSSGRPSFTSAEEVESIFGKKSSNPPFIFDDVSTDESAEVTTLRTQLDSILVGIWLDSDVVLHLPTVAEVDNLRQDLSVIEDELEAVSTGTGFWVDLESVKQELERKSTVLKRVAALARFNGKLVDADASLSNLLNSIDANSSDLTPCDDDPFAIPASSSNTPLADALLAASATVTAVRKGAIPLIDDARVKGHVERIEEAYGEMMAMVEDLERPPPSPPGSAPGLESARPFQTTPRRQSRSSTRASSRPPSSASITSSRGSSTSTRGGNPSAPPSRPSSIASRQSTVSLQTPTRRTSLAPSPTPTPRRRTSSAIPLATPRASLSIPRPTSTIPRGFSFGSTSKKTARADLSRSTSSIPQSPSRRESLSSSFSFSSSRRDSTQFPRRDSVSSSLSSSTSSRRVSQAFNTSGRYSRASVEPRRQSSTFSPPKVKKAYKANPNRKVDIEVARIVNELEMHVPITAAEGALNDESGMYWIGEADTGRLYFCRILRSKTVMVRVGGGWQGLLPFIISHFGSTDVTISPRVSPSNSLQANDPHWISSRSVSASQSSTSSLANFLSVSASSSLLSSTTSFGRRTVSGGASPLRRSSRSSFGGLPANTTPKAHKPLPQWKP